MKFFRKIALMAPAVLVFSFSGAAQADITNAGFVVTVFYDGQPWRGLTVVTTVPPSSMVQPSTSQDTRTIARCENGGLSGRQVVDGISAIIVPQGNDANGVINARVVINANHINAIRTITTGSCSEQVVDADAGNVDRVFAIGPKPVTVLQAGPLRAQVQRADLVFPH